MSTRHQQSRRRSYGRRQHELHERHERQIRTPADEVEAFDEQALVPLDLGTQRLARLSFAAAPLSWAKGAA